MVLLKLARKKEKYQEIYANEDESLRVTDKLNATNQLVQWRTLRKRFKHLQCDLKSKILVFDQQIPKNFKKLGAPGNKIVHLSLGSNNLDDKYARKIADALLASAHNLTSLDLSNNKLTGNGLATVLNSLNSTRTSSIVKLDFSQNSGVKPENIEALFPELLSCTTLAIFLFSKNDVGQHMLPRMITEIATKAPQLNVLDLQGAVTRAGKKLITTLVDTLNEIAVEPGIHQLNLFGHWMQLDEARYASILNLAACGLTANEILLLTPLINVNIFVEILDLSDNKLNGDVVAEILDTLAGHPTLRELYLQGNIIYTERFIAESPFWDDCDLERFCVSTQVWEVRDFKGTSDDVFEINIKGAETTKLDKAILARLLETNVVLLQLNGLEMLDKDDHFDFASHQLDLYEFVFLCQRMLLHGHILTISFAFCELDSKYMNYLAGALRDHKSLQKLDLESNNLGDVGFVTLSSALMANSQLTDLNLSHNNASHPGIERLCQAISSNPKLPLKKLSLKGNMFSRKSFVSLNLVTRSKCSILEDLDLSFTEMQDVDLQSLFRGVDPLHFNLKCFNAAEHFLSSEGGTVLSNMMQLWQVNTLDLSGSTNVKLNVTCLKSIGELLQKNRFLQILHLMQVDCGDAGVRVIADYLFDNVSLKELNLGCNNIQGSGAAYLAENLKTNTALCVLSLQENEIGDEGAMAFASCLQMNTGITFLNLDSNGIGEAGAAAFLTLFELKTYSPDFTFLRLMNNEIPDDIIMRLHELSQFPISIDCKNEDI